MGLSYQCASSILLCSEDNSSIFGFEEEEEEVERHWSDCRPLQKNCDFYRDFLMDFPLLSDDCVRLLLQRELEHLPKEDYAKRLMNGSLNVSIRSDAIDWMLKVHAYYNFGPLSSYLSVNFLDRFLSSYELPQGKAWMTQLLSVACLSLAVKVEETQVPLLLDLQVSEAKFVFEARTIQRMELLLLSTLKWRMHAVTPFSFIDYFLHKLNEGNSPSKLSLSQSVELILSTIRGVDFLEFKPSEIAAATALSVMIEAQTMNVESAITCCCNVDKERVLKCYGVMQEEILISSSTLKYGMPSVPSMPQSPIGVLDAACLSYKSNEMISESQPSSHHSSPAAKRRKLSRASIS
ncbi:cyclin-D3-1 isoform X1 [Dendrobium catenatum]|uniref:Cyclin-D3-1 n=2 Tax=Dendrobium catenatum TaxID=906689 RepID=A0A2I0W482_9ASPA|nr:cyclin-D3-1 isoform X1 [Dendrobium catenatum]PKU70464.1 Cyclin-D3-1 [Dendrobium catenatum]